MKGHVRERGAGNWYAVISVNDPQTGKRKRKWHSLPGCSSKREADNRCAELIAKLNNGGYIEPSKLTVADFVKSRVAQWEASGEITARTSARYYELANNQIAPHIGNDKLQKLTTILIESWHNRLRAAGSHPRTIGHAHRVLAKALQDAVKAKLISENIARIQTAPKAPEEEMTIVQDVPNLIAKLAACPRVYIPALTALLTGMRRNEILALRWNRVDLDKATIQVREALEHTKAHGIRFKAPKSKAGRRDITLPDMLVEALRHYRKEQLELRLRLGAGRLPDDALLFGGIDGSLPSPSALSSAWADFAEQAGMPEITFHALRHTHASQLFDGGVDIVTISKRLGHSKPDITLRIYAHLFRKDDSKAADAINSALSSIRLH